MSPSIRRLAPADAPALFRFYRSLSRAVRDFYAPFGPVVTAEKIADHLAATCDGRALSLGLIGPRGAVLGHAFLIGLDRDRPVLGIGLRDRLLGRGWGRVLITELLRQGDALGRPVITLTVVKANARALALYQRVGFAIRSHHTFRHPDDSWYMERTTPSPLGRGAG